MPGIVNGVSAGLVSLNRGFVNLTGRYLPSLAGVKRNVLEVMNTCLRICSFVRNSGFGISCAIGVAGLITTSLCTGRGLSGILFTAPSKNDYSIYNRGSCVNPYNGSCSGCHFMQLLFGIGNITIFSSMLLKKIYQCYRRYILRAGVGFPVSVEDLGLLVASGGGICVLGISSLDFTDLTGEDKTLIGSTMIATIYGLMLMYFTLALLRLEERYLPLEAVEELIGDE